jgi:hypothetical protein
VSELWIGGADVNRVFFRGEIAAAVLGNVRSFPSQYRSQIERAAPGTAIRIRPVGSIREHGKEVWGLRIELRRPMTMAHSGWIYYQARRAVEDDETTRVGLLLEDEFAELTQFALLRTRGEAYLLAAGPRAREALRAVAEAETSYNPANFDSDGYRVA